MLEQINEKDTGQTEGSAYLQELLTTFAKAPVGDRNVKGTINEMLRFKNGLGDEEQAKLKAFAGSLDQAHYDDFKAKVLDKL